MRGDRDGTSEMGGHGKGTTHWKRERGRGRSSIERSRTFLRVWGRVERKIRG